MSQPQWHDCDLTLMEVLVALDKDLKPLAPPGTVIRMESGDEHVVGNLPIVSGAFWKPCFESRVVAFAPPTETSE